jgi:hypothetical protein
LYHGQDLPEYDDTPSLECEAYVLHSTWFISCCARTVFLLLLWWSQVEINSNINLHLFYVSSSSDVKPPRLWWYKKPFTIIVWRNHFELL